MRRFSRGARELRVELASRPGLLAAARSISAHLAASLRTQEPGTEAKLPGAPGSHAALVITQGRPHLRPHLRQVRDVIGFADIENASGLFILSLSQAIKHTFSSRDCMLTGIGDLYET